MPDATVEVNTQRMDGDWARTVILVAYVAVTFQAAWLAARVCCSLQRNHRRYMKGEFVPMSVALGQLADTTAGLLRS